MNFIKLTQNYIFSTIILLILNIYRMLQRMNKQKMSNSLQWKIYGIVVSILAVISFTNLVIPYGVADPFYFGLPRTLWAGMGISLSIYAVLLIAMFTSADESEEDSSGFGH